MTTRSLAWLSAPLVAAGLLACAPTWRIAAMPETEIGVIPQPQGLRPGKGAFRLTVTTKILVDTGAGDLQPLGEYLADLLRRTTGFPLEVIPGEAATSGPGAIVLTTRDCRADVGGEGYVLLVATTGVTIRARTPAGIFYGAQTFRQLLPPEIEGSNAVEGVVWEVPAVTIQDQPRFAWRGLLLDCCRHFMDKEFVKRTIDLLAYYKMNRFHWHLTEDQGWRIEIPQYPRLTEVGAWRTDPDGQPYGGYYTQDDIREVVAYAVSRFVTVVPEIEMPGHSVAALAAYPELSCRGEPLEVQTRWGVHKDVYCAGNDQTFAFLEDVLTEVMALFPGEYIHIGGDECPKDRWQQCAKCQARIQAEGLANEDELQSWFIARIERFLNAHGRKLIGWDEILEGGLAPEATVQSWRGVDGAVAAARQGHDAIVSPTSHAYFDYDVGITDLRQVHTFTPVPPELAGEPRRHILGGECNMWTERTPQEKVDSMVFPRLLAMAECLWTASAERDFESFWRRVRHHYQRLDRLGITYGPEARPVTLEASFDISRDEFVVELATDEADLDLHYTLDGSTPNQASPRYTGAIRFQPTTAVKARAFRDGYPYGAPLEKTLQRHAGLGCTVHLTHPPSERYATGGSFALVNGLHGSQYYRDGYWQGFEGVDFEAVVDLGTIATVRRVAVGFLQDANRWIFLPMKLEYALSLDAEEYHTIGYQTHDIMPDDLRETTLDMSLDLNGIQTRYLRIRAYNRGVCPPNHPSAGGKAWLFVDEIVVE